MNENDEIFFVLCQDLTSHKRVKKMVTGSPDEEKTVLIIGGGKPGGENLHIPSTLGTANTVFLRSGRAYP